MLRIVLCLFYVLMCCAVLTAQTPAPSEAEEIKPALPAPETLQPPAPVSMTLALPTENDALLRGDFPAFYMFIDRNFEKEQTTTWEGGQYGFVRGPVRVGDNVVLMHFHEGMDVAPVKRDEKGEPVDEVRSIMQGEIVHVSDSPGASNYGRYVVIKHDWGQGPFYSLYAHLSKIMGKEGDKVEAGAPFAIMGHTGAGIDRRRAHTHVELNLMLNTQFSDWYDGGKPDSPNRHGDYNGLNLAGLDIAGLYLALQKNPTLTVPDYIKNTECVWKVAVPRKGDIEMAKNYPWLAEGCEQLSPSWEISFAGGGLPLKIKPSDKVVTSPQVVWVKDEGIPASYHTRGCVSGNGTKFALTSIGLHYVQLITGDFSKKATPSTPAKKKSPSASSKSKKKK